MNPEVQDVLDFVRKNPGHTARMIAMRALGGYSSAKTIVYQYLQALQLCGFIRRDYVLPASKWYAVEEPANA